MQSRLSFDAPRHGYFGSGTPQTVTQAAGGSKDKKAKPPWIVYAGWNQGHLHCDDEGQPYDAFLPLLQLRVASEVPNQRSDLLLLSRLKLPLNEKIHENSEIYSRAREKEVKRKKKKKKEVWPFFKS